MNADQYLALEEGTVLEAGKLLPALNTEPMTHEVIAVDKEKRVITLRCCFYGIFVGILIGQADDSKMKWVRKTGATG